MNLKTVLYYFLGIILILVTVALFFWTFKRDYTFRLFINSPLSTLATKDQQVDPDAIWPQIQSHKNPANYRDDFDGAKFDPVWNSVNLNGKGIVTHPPIFHSANANIENGQLILSVLHDREFDKELSKANTGAPAAEKYNNAYTVGFAGYSPTSSENVVIESKFSVSPDFHGTTGIWVEEENTFDENGVVIKPFRAFGISFVGSSSKSFMKGIQLEAVVGFVPVCAKEVKGVDVTKSNTYTLIWSIKNRSQMQVDLLVNGTKADTCTFPAFYPGEIQLWADNFKVDDLNISFTNIPENSFDHTDYDYVSIEIRKK